VGSGGEEEVGETLQAQYDSFLDTLEKLTKSFVLACVFAAKQTKMKKRLKAKFLQLL
jgi:hypothetical protein